MTPATVPLLLLLIVPLLGQGPAPVRVAKVEKAQRPLDASYLGTTRPHRSVSVGAKVAGRVSEMLVEDGALVAAQAPLLRLDRADVTIEIAVAEAELLLREQELAELENGSRKEDLAAARAMVKRREGEKRYADWRAKRSADLVAKGTIPEEDLYRDERNAAVADASLAEAEAALQRLETGARPEHIAQARARVAMQEAALARIRLRSQDHEVRAPMKGTIARRLVETGAWVRLGEPLVELVELDPLEIEVPVPEDAADTLRRGGQAELTLPSKPGVLSGRIVAILPLADPRARTVPVRISLPNPAKADGPALGGGRSIRVRFLVEGPESLLVPKDALVLGAGKTIVYRVNKGADGALTVEAIPVEVGQAKERWVEVRGALEAGQRVVTGGNERLRPGQGVRILSDR